MIDGNTQLLCAHYVVEWAARYRSIPAALVRVQRASLSLCSRRCWRTQYGFTMPSLARSFWLKAMRYDWLRKLECRSNTLNAASAFGMQVVWCNRYGQRRERLPGSPDREIGSLTQLPALVGAS